MRVNDHHKLPFGVIKLLLHTERIREGVGIPCEVLLAIGVLNIEPDNVVWDLELVKLAIDVLHILVRDIVPPTLMIGDGELLRQLSVTSQFAILLSEILWRGS